MFGARTVQKALGVNYRTFYRWIGPDGLVFPEKLPTTRGPGTRISLSLWDCLALSIIRDLKQMGISMQRVRQVVEELRERHPGLWDRILAEQLTEEPRIFIQIIREDGGEVRPVVVDLDREHAMELLTAKAGQFVLFDVAQRGRELHDGLKGIYEKSDHLRNQFGYTLRVSLEEARQPA